MLAVVHRLLVGAKRLVCRPKRSEEGVLVTCKCGTRAAEKRGGDPLGHASQRRAADFETIERSDFSECRRTYEAVPNDVLCVGMSKFLAVNVYKKELLVRMSLRRSSPRPSLPFRRLDAMVL